MREISPVQNWLLLTLVMAGSGVLYDVLFYGDSRPFIGATFALFIGMPILAFELPGGKMMWGKWTFREIVAPERLTVVVSFSDEQRGVTRHPFAPGWPLETLSTTTFTEEGGKTRIDLVWDAINATPEEVALFANSHAGMNQGWNGMYEQLAEYLAARQAAV